MTAAKQVALVTGASSGMGKDFAKALMEEGYFVYALARRAQSMADLKALGAEVLAVDITQESEVQQAVNHILQQHGGVDVLVNNAGFGLYGPMETLSLNQARYQFEVNLFGLAHLTQLLLPNMRAKGRGKIINVSSMGGQVYVPLGAWYHASKHALEGWSDCLRVELKAFGIDVVVIQPGMIATAFGEVMAGPMEQADHGPYQEMVNSMMAFNQQNWQQGKASPTSVITRLVIQAVRAKRPKTRYVAGRYAKPMMFVRKWLGDRMYDRMLLTMAK